MKKLIIIAVIAVLAVGLYIAFGRSTEREPSVKYVTVPVERGTLTAEITCTGTLRPVVQVLVGSQVSGVVKELYADFESQVTAGQMIGLIDPALFEAKVAQAKADAEAAKASVAKAEVTLVDEERNLSRKTQLLEKQSISQSEYDTAKTKADAAKAQLEVDKARLLQMQAKLQEADLQLQYTRIVAPVNGVVTSRSVDVGQTVAASFQAPIMFTIAEDLKRMQVYSNVDEADIGRVEVGQKAIFTVPAFPEDTFDAMVKEIRNDPKVEQNVVTYNVVLDLDNSELKLRPGMTANVSILLKTVHDALMIPAQALRFIPSPEAARGVQLSELPEPQKGQKRVWKLDRDDRIKPIMLGIGTHAGERVQIFSKELNPGDRLVIEAQVGKGKQTQMRGFSLRF